MKTIIIFLLSVSLNLSLSADTGIEDSSSMDINLTAMQNALLDQADETLFAYTGEYPAKTEPSYQTSEAASIVTEVEAHLESEVMEVAARD